MATGGAGGVLAGGGLGDTLGSWLEEDFEHDASTVIASARQWILVIMRGV